MVNIPAITAIRIATRRHFPFVGKRGGSAGNNKPPKKEPPKDKSGCFYIYLYFFILALLFAALCISLNY